MGVSLANSRLYAQVSSSIALDYRKSYADRYLSKFDNQISDISYLKKYKDKYSSHSMGLSFLLHLKSRNIVGFRASYNRTGFRNTPVNIPDTVSFFIPDAKRNIYCYSYYHYSISIVYRCILLDRNYTRLFGGVEAGLNKTIHYIQDQYSFVQDNASGEEGGLRSTIDYPIGSLTPYPRFTLSSSINMGAEYNLSERYSINLFLFYTINWNKFETYNHLVNDNSLNYMFLTNPTKGYLYKYGLSFNLNYRLGKVKK